MAAPNTISENWDALVTTTLRKWTQTKLIDVISTSNPFLYLIKKRGLWKPQEELGREAAIPLMYGLAEADSYAGLDPILMQTLEGITAATYQWRNFATSVQISGDEESQNRSKAKMISLLESKVMQTELGIKEKVNKVILQGNKAVAAGNNIYDPYVSPQNASKFWLPLANIVDHDPTASRTTKCGNIDQSVSTNAFWRNITKQSAATTYAGLAGELDELCQDVSEGPGGDPDLWVCDKAYYRLYKRLLRDFHRNPSYVKADLPFKNIAFNDEALTWDTYMVDFANNSTTISEGTLVGLNTRFFEVQVDKYANFSMGPYQKPIGVDGKVAEILLRGAILCGNRKKQCVMDDIDLTIVA